MLTLNLTSVFKARGINYPYTYLVNAGISSHTASDLLNNKSGTLKLKNLEIICRLLHCTPNDLFTWSPSKNQNIPKSHPLQTLRNKPTDFNLAETIKTIPLSQLAEIVKTLKNQE